jgi:hypothetical protein
MELFVKVGDQVITVTQMQHGKKIPGTEGMHMDTHKAVLSDAVTGDMELVQLENEREAIAFIIEFLNPYGYPTGGIYDTLVKSQAFRM